MGEILTFGRPVWGEATGTSQQVRENTRGEQGAGVGPAQLAPSFVFVCSELSK